MQDKQKVTLYLPPELHRRLKVRAAIDADTMTDIAQKAIAFYLTHPETIEQQAFHGQTHRIYACPDCASPLALRDGEMVSLGGQSSILVEGSLPVEKPQKVSVVRGIDSQGEGELIPC